MLKTDRATRCQWKCCYLLQNCRNTLYRQQIHKKSKYMELQHYSRPKCNKLCASRHDASTVAGVVNKLDEFVDNTIDLRWWNFLSPEFGTKFQMEVGPLLFWRYPDILITQCIFRTGGKQASMPKTSSIRSTVLTEPRLARDTDIHRHRTIIIIIAMTMFMVLSSWPKSLREFTRFIWWM